MKFKKLVEMTNGIINKRHVCFTLIYWKHSGNIDLDDNTVVEGSSEYVALPCSQLYSTHWIAASLHPQDCIDEFFKTFNKEPKILQKYYNILEKVPNPEFKRLYKLEPWFPFLEKEYIKYSQKTIKNLGYTDVENIDML